MRRVVRNIIKVQVQAYKELLFMVIEAVKVLLVWDFRKET